ncbi:MAG: hypothetical protein JSS97_06390 [Actinobacteria bacterium]|nr:hypothetical protein [Actinomycetota bacterium]
MIASLDLARFPFGVAEREALALWRAGLRGDAAFARLLLPMRLRTMPLPLPQLTFAYYFALWRDEAAPRDFLRFLLADRGVVAALDRAEGRLWGDGFIDDPARLDSGTLSFWSHTAAATAFAYAPGVHQDAVKAQRDGGWFSELWFARFAVEAARGSWRGVGARELLPGAPGVPLVA